MENIGFWTTVTYGNQPTTCSQKIFEMADGYLHLGSPRYQVIDPKKGEVTLSPGAPCSYWTTALKVASYALLIPVLVALIAKVILRCVYSFTVVKQPEVPKSVPLPKVETPLHIKRGDAAFIEAESELGRGVHLEGVPDKVTQVLGMRLMEQEGKMKQLNFDHWTQVYALSEIPQLVFKTTDTHEEVEKQFDSMVQALLFIRQNKLDQLVFPGAVKFELKESPARSGCRQIFIAQQRLDFNPDLSVQEGLYYGLSEDQKMRETVRQLTRFFIGVKGSDLKMSAFLMSDFRVVIIPGLYRFSGQNNHWRWNNCVELIHSLFSEQLIDEVIAAFGQEEIPLEVQDAKIARLKEIQETRRMYKCYQDRGIFANPYKPIETKFPDDLKDKALYEKALSRINQQIRKVPETFGHARSRSTQQRRNFFIRTTELGELSSVQLENFFKYLVEKELIFSHSEGFLDIEIQA